MAKLKARDIRKMTKDERKEKLEELRMELLKSRVATAKSGNSKVREIKRLIARITTINK